MKLPTLKFLATKETYVQFANETDENGSLKVTHEISTKSRLQRDTSATYTKEGAKVRLNAKAFIFEDLDKFPSENEVMGICEICNDRYDIVRMSKKYNPDGSIHHIVLELK